MAWASRAGALALQAGVDAGLPTGLLPVVAGGLLVVLTLPALLPPGALRLARGLPSLITVRGLFTGTFSGAEAFIPLMLVDHRGVTPALAGSALTVGSLGWTTGSWIQGSRRVRLERTTILTLGAALVALGVLLLAVTPLGSLPAWLVPLAWVVCACGMGLGMSSMSVLMLRLSPPGEEAGARRASSSATRSAPCSASGWRAPCSRPCAPRRFPRAPPSAWSGSSWAASGCSRPWPRSGCGRSTPRADRPASPPRHVARRASVSVLTP